jgi:putative transposase
MEKNADGGADHVAQPPSAGGRRPLGFRDQLSRASLDRPMAKPAEPLYRRNLPHIQTPDKTLYITFTTYHRWILPESVRMPILRHCLHDHEVKCQMHVVVVMPDHVHMIFTPGRDAAGAVFGMAEIMNGIKGASSHTVNRMLSRREHVWQDENMDHVLRSDEHLEMKVDYVLQNPVRKRFVQSQEQWPWRWVEGMEVPR